MLFGAGVTTVILQCFGDTSLVKNRQHHTCPEVPSVFKSSDRLGVGLPDVNWSISASANSARVQPAIGLNRHIKIHSQIRNLVEYDLSGSLNIFSRPTNSGKWLLIGSFCGAISIYALIHCFKVSVVFEGSSLSRYFTVIPC